MEGNNSADGPRRLAVLSRQLTAGVQQEAPQELLDGRQVANACPRELYSILNHDNAELRDAIFDFLKVWCSCCVWARRARGARAFFARRRRRRAAAAHKHKHTQTHTNTHKHKHKQHKHQDPMYRPNEYLSMLEFRELTLQRLKKFAARRFFCARDYLDDPRRFMAGLECLSFADYSLAIKAGVHFTLCGGTICKLGTAKHHDALLHRLDDLSLPGSFGMTELGHGSNVMGIQTTVRGCGWVVFVCLFLVVCCVVWGGDERARADDEKTQTRKNTKATFDAATDEFVLNTPSNEASKIWIGGTGQHGKVCVVFAQLTVGGAWQGPHVFVVRIRDDAGVVMPGVRVVDMGPKMGLNGVDNGQFWLDRVRVPRDALLDAFASVDATGGYTSSIPTVSARFGTMVGGLTTGELSLLCLLLLVCDDACCFVFLATAALPPPVKPIEHLPHKNTYPAKKKQKGRVLIGQGAIDMCKIALTIALRYVADRPQFGDTLVLDYLSTQRRLLPGLAATYALHLSMGELKVCVIDFCLFVLLVFVCLCEECVLFGACLASPL